LEQDFLGQTEYVTGPALATQAKLVLSLELIGVRPVLPKNGCIEQIDITGELDHLSRDTAGHFEPILHYKVICQMHLIDVASYSPLRRDC
jgi:hypothetical protein